MGEGGAGIAIADNNPADLCFMGGVCKGERGLTGGFSPLLNGG